MEKICDQVTEDSTCGSKENLRHFNHGYRCPIHTPQALKGEPELPPGPGIPAYRPGYTPHGPVRPYPPASNFPRPPHAQKGAEDDTD